MSVQSIAQACSRRLRGAAAHGAHGHIHNIHPGIDGPGIGIDTVAAAIMGMQMDRHLHRIFQRRRQCIGCLRLQQTRHIFNGNDIGAGSFQLFRHVHIIF